MNERKYKLTDEYIIFRGIELHRIEALKDFSDVKIGDKGGYVASENNLSQIGKCWVYDNAKVFENAMVSDNARVYENAFVHGDSKIREDAGVLGNAEIYGNAKIYDNATVYGDTLVYDNAIVCGNASVYDNAEVCGNAFVSGHVNIHGAASICGNAKILNQTDYIVFKNWWSSGRYFTWTKSNNMWKVGGFYNTSDYLLLKAYKDSALSGREYERVVKYVESILQGDIDIISDKLNKRI